MKKIRIRSKGNSPRRVARFVARLMRTGGMFIGVLPRARRCRAANDPNL